MGTPKNAVLILVLVLEFIEQPQIECDNELAVFICGARLLLFDFEWVYVWVGRKAAEAGYYVSESRLSLTERGDFD